MSLYQARVRWGKFEGVVVDERVNHCTVELDDGETFNLTRREFEVIARRPPIAEAIELLEGSPLSADRLRDIRGTLEACKRELTIALAWTQRTREPEVRLWRAEVKQLLEDYP